MEGTKGSVGEDLVEKWRGETWRREIRGRRWVRWRFDLGV